MILKPQGDTPTDLTLTPHQMGLILGLEPILTDAASSLWLMCPHCVANHNDISLQTDNSPEDTVWKIHCRCHRRSILRASVLTTMPPAAGLLVHAQELLPTAQLVIRCPTNRKDCRHSPLTIRPEGPGGWLVACGCARRHFRPKSLARSA